MRKREQIAAMAMQGLNVNPNYSTMDGRAISQVAVKMADALLAELERTKPEDYGWIHHKPGDPMPCEEGDMIHIRLRNGEDIAGNDPEFLDWGEIPHATDVEIIAWKPAK